MEGRRGRAVAVALVAGLAVGGAVLLPERLDRTGPAPAPPDPSATATTSPDSPQPPAVRPSPRSGGVRPPVGTLHVAARYLAPYQATRASWDQVIDGGRPLPAVDARCADSWRTAGRDARLNWKSARFLCLNGLQGRGYRLQGVAGSGTTRGYRIDGQPAAHRNLILTSWYSEAREPGLFAPNRPGERVTRLLVLDMDRRRYNTVELVRPHGSSGLRNLNSHGSGLVWAGQYLYSSSRSALWMYNADDLLRINGRFVLPAIARWTADGRGGLSSISLDRSTPQRLVAINYTKRGTTFVQSFELGPDGRLGANRRRRDHALTLRNTFGEQRRVVHSASTATVPGTSYQGVGRAGAYGFANSSSLKLDSRDGVDATVVFRGEEVLESFRMPHGNGQSIYIDHRRGRYVSATERGSQFLFDLPLEHLTAKATR